MFLVYGHLIWAVGAVVVMMIIYLAAWLSEVCLAVLGLAVEVGVLLAFMSFVMPFVMPFLMSFGVVVVAHWIAI